MPFGFGPPVSLSALKGAAANSAEAAKGAIVGATRAAIPAEYRWFLSSMMGDRSPLTEKNYSPSEIAALRKIVAADQARLPWRAREQGRMAPVWARQADSDAKILASVRRLGRGLTEEEAMKAGVDYQMGKPVKLTDAVAQLSDRVAHYGQLRDQAENVARRASGGVGAIRYDAPDEMSLSVASGYPVDESRRRQMEEGHSQAHIGPISLGVNYGDRNTNALANTLGEFAYKTLPNGSVVINDNYNWGHFREPTGVSGQTTEGFKPWAIPDSLGTLLTTGNIEPLISMIMPDAVHGRPVHITLPPNPSDPTRSAVTPSAGRFGFGPAI